MIFVLTFKQPIWFSICTPRHLNEEYWYFTSFVAGRLYTPKCPTLMFILNTLSSRFFKNELTPGDKQYLIIKWYNFHYSNTVNIWPTKCDIILVPVGWTSGSEYDSTGFSSWPGEDSDGGHRQGACPSLPSDTILA